jgi:cephalosporin-C deacetylase-like acetyl esterase
MKDIEIEKTYSLPSGRSTWLRVLIVFGGYIVEAWPSWTLGSRAPPSLNRYADDCRGAGDSCNEDMEPQLNLQHSSLITTKMIIDKKFGFFCS